MFWIHTCPGVIVLLASKYKHQSHTRLHVHHCENKLIVVTQFSSEVGTEQHYHPLVKTRWRVGISPCHMIRTFLLYSIQSMLNSCERLSATVTAKKVTLILSTIVLLQGPPAGNAEQAQGAIEREGRRGSIHLPASALAACREAATPTLCLPYEGSSWSVRTPISRSQTQHTLFYTRIPWCKVSQWWAAQQETLCFP